MRSLFVKIPSLLFLCTMIFVWLGAPASAAALANGTYSYQYSVIKPDSGSASIADGYFSKPATVVAKDGKLTVQITITSSSIKEFQVESAGSLKDVSVLSTNGESRVVQFSVYQLSSPTNARIHVIASESYNHWYSIRLSFNEASQKVIQLEQLVASSSQNTTTTSTTSTTETQGTATSTATQSNVEKVENPATGDDSSNSLLITCVIAAFILVTTFSLQKQRGQVK